MRKKGLTSEDVWAMFAETDRKLEAAIRQVDKTGRQVEETTREMNRIFQQMDENSRKAAENSRRIDENSRRVDENSRRVAENSRRIDENSRRMDQLNANLGGISSSNGRFAEEYFYNSLERQMKFAEVHFDRISKDLKNFVKMPDGKILEDEFDIIMFNEKSVALIEVKYKASSEYIDDLVARKLKNFKALFPLYEKYKIYLGLGSLSFDKKTIDKAKKYGVGLLRQVGETIECKAGWKVKAY